MKRLDQSLYIGVRRAQDVKGEPLRRLLPDARQAFEFVDELGDGFGVIEHSSKQRGREPGVRSRGSRLWLSA